MTDLRRLANGDSNDPAALLLRSARADQVPSGAKDRIRSELGLGADQFVEMARPKEATELLMRYARKKRTISIATPALFQNVISPASPVRHGKVGAMLAALVQVAILMAAAFSHPVASVETAIAQSEVHQDEPEVVFIMPAAHREVGVVNKESASVVAEPKTVLPRKEASYGRGKIVPPTSETHRLPTESVVAEEHASALTERDDLMKTAAKDGAAIDSMQKESAPAASKAIPFGADMTRPVQLSGRSPAYTRQALVARVQGTVVMKCVITEAGLAQDCVILKGLPHLDDAVLSASHSWRFSPAKLNNRPVAAQYIFRFHFKL